MYCSKCGSKTHIVDSRSVPEGVRRRHECPYCNYRFNTLETTLDVYDVLLYVDAANKFKKATTEAKEAVKCIVENTENIKRAAEVLFKDLPKESR